MTAEFRGFCRQNGEMKEFLKKSFETLMPDNMHLFARYIWAKHIGTLDEEMLFVSKLLTRRRRFLDVGTHYGLYSYHFSKSFEKVDSFEPLSDLTYRLRALKRKEITVHNIALSDREGNLQFNIPIENGRKVVSRASLEKKEGDFEVRNVDVKKLDHFGFDDVDLIKIDVEGHEASVLLGAADTLKKSAPILIVEIEQRHIGKDKDIQDVFKLVDDLGYDGFFLKDHALEPISSFSYDVHQKPFLNDVASKNYINNFIFVPKTK